jgi:hypothetical protein
MFWEVIRVILVLPSATLRATLRQTAEISLSKLRTPASLVYWAMICLMAPRVNEIRVSSRAFPLICLGTRCLMAICSFSSSV